MSNPQQPVHRLDSPVSDDDPDDLGEAAYASVARILDGIRARRALRVLDERRTRPTDARGADPQARPTVTGCRTST